MAGTSRACRAVIAVRLADPAREWEALRALQRLQFLSGDRLDDDAAIGPRGGRGGRRGHRGRRRRGGLRARPRRGPQRRRHARRRAGQDGHHRRSRPLHGTVGVFRAGERELVAGGFQSLVAYDVLLANLDPELERRAAPEDPAAVLAAFPDGLYTAEVAEISATGAASEVDVPAAEASLIAAAAAGRARRDGDLWLLYPLRGWHLSDK